MQSDDSIRVSVVTPVYGSANILPELVRQLQSSLERAYGKGQFEAILVHDCGPDDAWSVLKSLVSEHPWLGAIDLRKNAGQHNAIMAGLAHTKGRCIVTMDDDLQHSPSDIPKLVSQVESGADVCYAQFKSRKHAHWKRVGSRFNDLVAQKLLKKPKGLYLSPFRAMSSDIRDELLRYEGPFVYVDGLILQATRNVATIEVEHHLRGEGESGYSLKKSVSLWLQMATSFSVTPLRLVSFAGICASICGFLLATVVVAQKLSDPELALGWASLMISVLVMGGMQLIALGVIGEYLGRVLLTLNRKPQHIIRERIGVAST